MGGFHETTTPAGATLPEEAFLSSALEIARTGAWDLDLVDLTARSSPEHDRIFGYDPGSLSWTYEEFLRHVVPEDREEVDRTFRQAIDSGRDVSLECRIVRADGDQRWIWAAGRHLAAGGHEARRMAGIVQDITDRKVAEESLRASEARLKFAQEAAGAGMWHWDLRRGELQGSDQLYRLFGLDRRTCAPFLLDAWRDIVHPDDRAEAERSIEATIATGLPLVNEHRIVLPSGEIRWISAWGKTSHDDKGLSLSMSGICLDITARKRAEEALRDSELLARQRLAELEAIYETAPIGLCVFDENLRWMRVNQVIAEINGKPIDAHIGRTPGEVVPDVAQQAEAALRQILRTGERLDFEMRGTTAAQPGVERFWSEHWVPVKDADGRVTGISVAAEEITERKRAAEALIRSEERFRTLAENAPEVIARFDQDLRYTYVNRYGGRLHGLPADQIIGRTTAELGMSPEQVAFWKAQFEEIADSGEPRTIEYEFHSPTLGHQFLSTVIVPEPGPSFSVLAIARDVTPLMRVENALRESEAQFRRLADAMPQVVWTARADGQLDYVNARVAELAGAARRDDGTWVWTVAIDPDDRDSTTAAWAAAVRHGTNYEITHRIKRSDGSVHWYLTRAIPIRDEEGRIVKWFGTGTDIHMQKQAEQALQEADQRKNEFLGALSHELRNPLGVVRTSLALIEAAGLESPQAVRALPVLQRQVTHMTRLLDDLLDVTRITKGKVHLQFELVDLNELVRIAAEDQRPLFERDEVELEVTVAPAPLGVEADRARIAQVLINLLQNAEKFTRAGGHVALSVRREAHECVVEVRDDGAGMAPELVTRVFDPLVQDSRTIHRSRGGLGLGLPLVKGLVELHGGSVAAASDGPGRGSLFTVRLPLVPEDPGPRT